MIEATHVGMSESNLERTLGFEDRPHVFVVWVEWRHPLAQGQAVVHREAYPLPKDTTELIQTTQGLTARSLMIRTIELVDVPNEIAVAVVWRLHGEVVRRDVHVILKQASVVATAIAASIG